MGSVETEDFAMPLEEDLRGPVDHHFLDFGVSQQRNDGIQIRVEALERRVDGTRRVHSVMGSANPRINGTVSRLARNRELDLLSLGQIHLTDGRGVH